MKVHCIWVMEHVGGESEGEMILILMGKSKAIQRQEEMRDGQVKKGECKKHELLVLVTENLGAVIIPFGSFKSLSFSDLMNH